MKSSYSENALKGIMRTVKSVVEDMLQNKENIPQPLSSKKYSGKITVHVPPDIHRQLAIKAAKEGITLNRLASSKLSQ